MATQSFSIEFEGYWRDKDAKHIPAKSGVFCVYSAILKKKIATPVKLVFIGQAENVAACIPDHEKRDNWEAHLESGEELCFSFAPLGPEDRERLAAALIAKNKPPENRGQEIQLDETTVSLTGQATFLSKSFTVSA